ncbi:MAG: hypothetical protein C4527_18440 [Candidatus Omnitrophota bacterium]|nr:MAG: hypothetical protein C4527_18440 [Candidatus Omnitrophota bacterium]
MLLAADLRMVRRYVCRFLIIPFHNYSFHILDTISFSTGSIVDGLCFYLQILNIGNEIAL